MEFESWYMYQTFLSRKCIWKCCLWNGSHFVQASICQPIKGMDHTLLSLPEWFSHREEFRQVLFCFVHIETHSLQKETHVHVRHFFSKIHCIHKRHSTARPWGWSMERPLWVYSLVIHVLHSGPLARYVKLRVAHAPGTFSPPRTSKETTS